MRILVTGSRDWTDGVAIGNALTWAATGGPLGDEPSRTILVHGGARGADAIAATFARTWGWEVEEHLAPWRDMGKRAGILRNQHMVDLGADICLAFIKDQSAGASHCAARAERAGIPTLRFPA